MVFLASSIIFTLCQSQILSESRKQLSEMVPFASWGPISAALLQHQVAASTAQTLPQTAVLWHANLHNSLDKQAGFQGRWYFCPKEGFWLLVLASVLLLLFFLSLFFVDVFVVGLFVCFCFAVVFGFITVGCGFLAFFTWLLT